MLLQRLSLTIFVCLTLTGGMACLSSRNVATNNKATTFKNPIGNGADPWVIRDGKYYYTCSGGPKNSIAVSRSLRLSEIGPKKVVWSAPDSGWNSRYVWAPELHKIGDKWYIYYAAGHEGPKYIYQRSGVLESVTSDPQGAYVDKGPLITGIDKNDMAGAVWAIDLTTTKINGQRYAIWSGWLKNGTEGRTGQHLYIAKMSNPWTISSERRKLSSPEESWETGGPLDLQEGPQVLKHNGNIFVIYSTRESWLPAYRLGQLRLLDSTKNIMDPANWKKSGPVFEGNEHAIGPGHSSYTTSPDGSEWWIFYHTKKSASPGWERDLRIQPFTWKADGNPNFGQPLPLDSIIKVPSGEN